jgi:NCS2 family nucleobase:cation symporter-2
VFEPSAIIAFFIVLMVTFTESTADMLAVGEIVGRMPSEKAIAAGLRMDAVSQVMAGFMNSFPDTAFAENVGLVSITGVRSRWVVTVCGALLFAMGLIPKLGEVVASLPGPVVGGAATVMFAMVTSVGIHNLQKVRFNGKYAHNLLIVAVALSCALIPAYQPLFFKSFPDWFQVIFTSPITSAVIVVFILNLLFNHFGADKQPEDQVSSVH